MISREWDGAMAPPVNLPSKFVATFLTCAPELSDE